MHRVTALAFLLAVTAILAGCGEKKYKVDYDGRKSSFSNAKDYYKAGEQVTVWMEFIATDTDYHFYLDGEPFRAEWDERGYVISFVMPEHDVKLTYKTENTMEYRPPFDLLKEEDQQAVFSDTENKDGQQTGTVYRVYSSYGDYLLEVENIGVSRELHSVSADLLSEMKKIIDENDMASWNETYEEQAYQTPEGYAYMNAVYADEEGQICADVSRMPENGPEVFAQLRELFRYTAEHSWLMNYEEY